MHAAPGMMLQGDKGDQGKFVLRLYYNVDQFNRFNNFVGAPGLDGALISWNECAWQSLNSGVDYGLIAVCPCQNNSLDLPCSTGSKSICYKD